MRTTKVHITQKFVKRKKPNKIREVLLQNIVNDFFVPANKILPSFCWRLKNSENKIEWLTLFRNKTDKKKSKRTDCTKHKISKEINNDDKQLEATIKMDQMNYLFVEE